MAKRWPEKVKHDPSLIEASSFVHSCHILGLRGNNALIDSRTFLNFSIRPIFLRILMYCKNNHKRNNTKDSTKYHHNQLQSFSSTKITKTPSKQQNLIWSHFHQNKPCPPEKFQSDQTTKNIMRIG
eukprot:TRINITY_DN2607_c0_g1_i2.p1 TRINITY_DN2607_c0_g1~~TRINITY_DN2607_c0_g1_i2.p1  ORF type:complete len:141 (-),score=18.76 TRINITY_DN2607_c0_g1_i2:787-1164(-)